MDLVAGYERAAGFDVPGQYAGLVVDFFRYGDLTDYLLGRPEGGDRGDLGAIALLGCDCGEFGCWPLQAQVVADEERVTWRGFVQPHRPKRDYWDFGPFVFERRQYEQAVRDAAAILAERD
ncbi:hypothetical protein [Actinoplanes ianthinogenes]|uniref:hypothetical protein n=1 Tax=Actinoplanes ianthinogenes TaxID=122358 RepID=UPI0016703228|nr:hypothetical protein [Actinoplanes ianthinogenes]